jgi:hypothetical protein
MMPEAEDEYFPTSEPKKIGCPFWSILMQADFIVWVEDVSLGLGGKGDGDEPSCQC